jgi:hypothetical protein
VLSLSFPKLFSEPAAAAREQNRTPRALLSVSLLRRDSYRQFLYIGHRFPSGGGSCADINGNVFPPSSPSGQKFWGRFDDDRQKGVNDREKIVNLAINYS